ncbi:hypothetical protein L7F22_037074 [Adiantum nelumboides]|nr:hypothetical protein [Adiantum nelumboides]
MMLKMIHGDYFVGSKVTCTRNVAIASRIFVASKCFDVLELLQVKNLLFANYGKEFIVAATELWTDCEVNRLIIEKLFVRAPSEKVKLKLMNIFLELLAIDAFMGSLINSTSLANIEFYGYHNGQRKL